MVDRVVLLFFFFGWQCEFYYFILQVFVCIVGVFRCNCIVCYGFDCSEGYSGYYVIFGVIQIYIKKLKIFCKFELFVRLNESYVFFCLILLFECGLEIVKLKGLDGL